MRTLQLLTFALLVTAARADTEFGLIFPATVDYSGPLDAGQTVHWRNLVIANIGTDPLIWGGFLDSCCWSGTIDSGPLQAGINFNYSFEPNVPTQPFVLNPGEAIGDSSSNLSLVQQYFPEITSFAEPPNFYGLFAQNLGQIPWGNGNIDMTFEVRLYDLPQDMGIGGKVIYHTQLLTHVLGDGSTTVSLGSAVSEFAAPLPEPSTLLLLASAASIMIVRRRIRPCNR